LTGADLTEARRRLGVRWGLCRPLHMSELAQALRLVGNDPGGTIRDYESGKKPISGPISVCIEMWLGGAPPPEGLL
jgi:hypothetical protein